MKRKKIARWTPGLKKLKAISIRQPWAWLIVNGYKDIENRTWQSKLRGRVLIHAGQSKAETSDEALTYIKRRYRIADLPGQFDTGGIVGIAEIKDCVKRHLSKWFHGPFGWVLENTHRLPFKKCKGRLQFFKPKIYALPWQRYGKSVGRVRKPRQPGSSKTVRSYFPARRRFDSMTHE